MTIHEKLFYSDLSTYSIHLYTQLYCSAMKYSYSRDQHLYKPYTTFANFPWVC